MRLNALRSAAARLPDRRARLTAPNACCSSSTPRPARNGRRIAARGEGRAATPAASPPVCRGTPDRRDARCATAPTAPPGRPALVHRRPCSPRANCFRLPLCRPRRRVRPLRRRRPRPARALLAGQAGVALATCASPPASRNRSRPARRGAGRAGKGRAARRRTGGDQRHPARGRGQLDFQAIVGSSASGCVPSSRPTTSRSTGSTRAASRIHPLYAVRRGQHHDCAGPARPGRQGPRRHAHRPAAGAAQRAGDGRHGLRPAPAPSPAGRACSCR